MAEQTWLTDAELEALRGHTPGPWVAYESGQPVYDQQFLITSSSGAIGYWKGHKDWHTDHHWLLTRADSNLIAAATALLAEVIERRARDAAVAELVETATAISVHRDTATSGQWERFDDALAAVRGGVE